MPKRRYHSSSDPILTPKLLKEFFLEKARLAHRLTFKDVQYLRDAYPFAGFEDVLLPLQIYLSRRSVRLETQMRAKVGPEAAPAEVMNVSKEGLQLRMRESALTIGQLIQVDVWLNETSSTQLKAEVRWCPDGSSLFGLRIVKATPEWSTMIEALESDYKRLSEETAVAA
jgi:hypothetical protein